MDENVDPNAAYTDIHWTELRRTLFGGGTIYWKIICT